MKNAITNKEKYKGITLIALVITIIVLLILAGVTIAILGGENGLLNRATGAKQKHVEGQALEEINLKISEVQIEKNTEATLKDLVENLKNDTANTYIVTTNSRLATLDEQGITEVNNITDGTKQIYVTNLAYGVEIKVTDLLVATIIKKNEETGEEEEYIQTPTGIMEITANGEYDVTHYATANVNVPGGELQAITLETGYPKESSLADRNTSASISLTFSENTTYYLLCYYQYPYGNIPPPASTVLGTSQNISFSNDISIIGQIGPLIQINTGNNTTTTLKMNTGTAYSPSYMSSIRVYAYK